MRECVIHAAGKPAIRRIADQLDAIAATGNEITRASVELLSTMRISTSGDVARSESTQDSNRAPEFQLMMAAVVFIPVWPQIPA